MAHIWGLWRQKQVSQAGISNYIPQFTVGCNYLSLPEIPASDAKVLIYLSNNHQRMSINKHEKTKKSLLFIYRPVMFRDFIFSLRVGADQFVTNYCHTIIWTYSFIKCERDRERLRLSAFLRTEDIKCEEPATLKLQSEQLKLRIFIQKYVFNWKKNVLTTANRTIPVLNILEYIMAKSFNYN